MKVRSLRVEIFTGSGPESLTNGNGETLQDWLQSRSEEELIEPIVVESVGSEAWVFIQYAEG